MSTMPVAAEPDADGHLQADVVVVGAGLAGLYATIELPDDLDLVVVDKDTPDGRSGSSSWAQGGMAVALGPDDSPELHVTDTIRAGDGLVDRAAAHVLATEAPDRTRHLLELGVGFDTVDGTPSTDPGALHLAREGGQRIARSVHTADATGAEMVRVVRAVAAPRVRRLGGSAVAIAREPDGPCRGVWVQLADGTLVRVSARAVLLATGGCGGLFAATTNQGAATADGVTLAHLAGAAVRDVEFVQFHPTGLAVDGSWRFLLTEALRGAGATLHDGAGRRFMQGRHPDAELAPRHVVAAAILDQPDGVAWLDATGIGARTLEHEFPTVLAGSARYGFDLATERVPVTPAAHYMVGGVRTDLWARTSLPGLYAAGEVASTGVHGANRMAGNSLVEALVFGGRAAAAIAQDLPGPDRAGSGPAPDIDRAAVDTDLDRARPDLRARTSAGAGPIRSAASLQRLGDDLAVLAARLGTTPTAPTVHADPAVTALRRALYASELIRSSALVRAESRGGHVRTDFPEAHPGWAGLHLERVGPADGVS